ncbi:crossover junction endodeoxyribonuclease RuvC [Paracoccus seriniphilus]|uniref:Crossover junction endodeoxyribonuclease RuvC n=1 Tax=Paracoccus seriniphilus TaxID=184748 RepID=A0A239Q1W5_9RHOB|nr:crossover junction endodeoxyribonuclease RuvC [Paracoccus seriniphilus]WCR14555.1 crossover junction endodeoxyribonuclease RuvC [Paracoccus seriniphilus]SNT76589.1 Holliday junction endonuclease RuvC [Paracoccus seriniphilus]
MRVLGIDPGLRNMGWGIIDMDGPRLRHVANGVVRSQADGSATDLAARLSLLFRGLSAVIAQYRPDAAAVEQTFVNKDATGTLKLGQARGIALLAPAEAGLEVGEYAPNAVKKTVVGVGHAGKEQVQHMVRVQLPGVQFENADAADALAIAICHAHHLQGRSLRVAVARGGMA